MRYFFKLLLGFVFFLCLSCTSFGQLGKKTWLVGGDFDFNYQDTHGGNNDNHKSTFYTLKSHAGYFIIDRLAVGLAINIAFSGEKYRTAVGGQGKFRTIALYPGPFVRYYLFAGERVANIVTHGELLYGTSTTKNAVPSVRSSYNFWEYGFYTGPAFFFTSSVGLEALIGYTHRNTPDQNAKLGTFKFTVGFTIHLIKE